MTDPDPYFTAAEARALSPALGKAGAAADPAIALFIAEFEPIAENRLGVAYRVRTATYTGRVAGGVIELPHREIVAVTSITLEGGGTTTATRVDKRNGTIEVGVCGVVTVVYTHGLAAPTAGVKGACLDYVARRYTSNLSAQSRDVIAQGGEGAVTRYATPNKAAGRDTGFLQTDALLDTERDYLVWLG